eukprot:PLAT3355.32.p1 GENE.PLAT3355.32~~PLAT3355.32.p1  ORF type:complete len:118 (-),score=46.90 PLAT3355.32:433-786(-)
MPRVSPDRFLSELDRLYEASREAGSIWLAMKPLGPVGAKARRAREARIVEGKEAAPTPRRRAMVVRARTSEVNFSCVIGPEQHASFARQLRTLVLAQSTALTAGKKKKKNRRKKGGS